MARNNLGYRATISGPPRVKSKKGKTNTREPQRAGKQCLGADPAKLEARIYRDDKNNYTMRSRGRMEGTG